MDGLSGPERVSWTGVRPGGTQPRRWVATRDGRRPRRTARRPRATDREEFRVMSSSVVVLTRRPGHIVLDGSRGEGGGQILRTALTLSLLTGRPFRMVKIRANRDKPGLRPQHQTAVEAAAELGMPRYPAAGSGSRADVFARNLRARDLTIDIGTAGSTGLVLQTLHLPMALRADDPTRVVLTGGTFNPKAPAFPFLETTWRGYLAAFGMPLALTMPAAGFYPRGGGRLEAWIEPALRQSIRQTERGPLRRLYGIAGVANLRDDIARRMRDRAIQRLEEHGFSADDRAGPVDEPGAGGRDLP